MRPVILITPDDAFEPEVFRPLYSLKRSYATAVLGAGGLAVMPVEPKLCLEYAEIADGLLLTDDVQSINPGRFGELYDKDAYPAGSSWYSNFSHTRDSLDLALCRAFLEKGKPILGLGRGMHIINVALGGTLHQGLKAEFPSHSEQKKHEISVKSGSVLESLIGSSDTVNNYHHQAVKALGEGLEAAAFSQDGVVEAIWHKSLPVIGIQWNPETLGTEDEESYEKYSKDPACENAAESMQHFMKLFGETHKTMCPMEEHHVDKEISLRKDNRILNYFVDLCRGGDAE